MDQPQYRALKKVLTTGINWQVNDRVFSHLRVRHLGKYPLDGGETADASTLVNWRMGYELNEEIQLTLDVLNLLDSNDRDIEYFYESQLTGELFPVDDHHYHVFEPRSLRLALVWRF
jgi:TonB dependent receptor